jgi:hypothetical protein
MTRTKLQSASFILVAALTFVGMALAFSGLKYSIGPNEYFSCGLTGWLELHRYGFSWSVEHIDVVALAIDVGLAVLATWALAKVSRAFLRRVLMTPREGTRPTNVKTAGLL